MNENFVVLEKWYKGGFTNRLVTDGKRIRMEYRTAYFDRGVWKLDNSGPLNKERFLKVFK